jgi:pSer/pThr/pTyr-binding forkhead associated (FHA) protein
MANGESDAAAVLTLEVALPSGKQLQFVLDARSTACFVLGRTGDVPIDDSTVSKVHAELFFDSESGWKLKDLQSTNGTRLNDKRVREITSIAEGDEISLGQSKVRIARLPVLEDPGAQTTPFTAWESPSDHVYVRDLRIEIDVARKEREVQEITESAYFRSLQRQASRLRKIS